MESIQSWKELLECSSERGTVDALSPCGARPQEPDAELLSERDRYGFPIKTWISRKSGLVWTSPRLSDDLTETFYAGHFQAIYRGRKERISRRFANQILRASALLDDLSGLDFDLKFSGARVLDVGCGAGGMLVPFAEMGSEIAGCDIGGKEYVEFGNKFNLNILHKSSTYLCEQRRTFDIIILSHVLEHIANPIEFLRSIRQLLCDSGFLICEVPGILNLDGYNGDFLRYLQNSHTHHYSSNTLAAVMRIAGLRVIRQNESVRIIAKKAEIGLPEWRESDYCKIRQYLQSKEDRIRLLKPIQRIRRVANRGLQLLRKRLK